MIARSSALCLFALASACGEPLLFQEREPGGQLLWATLNESGQVLRAGLILPAETGATNVTFPIEDGLIVWQIGAGALVDEAGPLDDSILDSLTVSIEPGASGCGRCQAPVRDWPQPLLEGDGCSVPSGAKGELLHLEGSELVPGTGQDDLVEAVRRTVKLVRPGECGCRTEPWPSLEAVRFEPRPGPEAAVRVKSVFDTPTGALYGVVPEGLWRFDGTEAVVLPDPIDKVLVEEGAGRAWDDSLILARRNPLRSPLGGADEVFRYRDDGTSLSAELLTSDLPFRPQGVHTSPEDPLQRVILSGRITGPFGRASSIATCDMSGASCALDDFAEEIYLEDENIHVHFQPDGRLYSIADTWVLWKIGADDAWNNLSTIQDVPGPSGAVTISKWQYAAIGERAIVACATWGRGPVVLRVPYDLSYAPDLARAEVVWEALDREAHCVGVDRGDAPEAPFTVQIDVALAAPALIELDPDGNLLGRREGAAVVGFGFQRLEHLAYGTWIAKTDGGELYSGPHLGALEKRYGPAAPFHGEVVGLVDAGSDRIIAVTNHGHLRALDGGVLSAITDPRGLLAGQLALGASADPSTPGTLMVLREDGLYAVAIDDQVQSVEAFGPRITKPLGVGWSGHGFLVANAARELLLVDKDGTERKITNIPGPLVDTIPFRVQFGRSGNVNWLASFDGVLMRGVGDAWSIIHQVDDRLEGLNVTCGDEVTLVAPDPVLDRWLLVRAPTEAEGTELVIDDSPLEVLFEPTALIHDGTGVAMLRDDGILYRSQGERAPKQLWQIPRLVLETRSLVVIGGESGGLTTARR